MCRSNQLHFDLVTECKVFFPFTYSIYMQKILYMKGEKIVSMCGSVKTRQALRMPKRKMFSMLQCFLRGGCIAWSKESGRVFFPPFKSMKFYHLLKLLLPINICLLCVNSYLGPMIRAFDIDCSPVFVWFPLSLHCHPPPPPPKNKKTLVPIFHPSNIWT